MCHGECYFQGVVAIGWRDPLEVFESITSFLEENPREVLVIDLQTDDNTLDDLYINVLSGIDGFIDLMYKHPRSGEAAVEWPLMSELIDMDQR